MRVTEIINIKNIIGDKWPTNPKTLALVDFIRNGGKTTPIKVIKTDDGNFILRDGRHRVLAFKLLGIEKIEAKFSTEINQSNNKMKNLEQFKALILKYESINESDFTDGQIANYGNFSRGVKAKILISITGYGTIESCTLCASVNELCAICVYAACDQDIACPCVDLDNEKTYHAIFNSNSIPELIKAYKARALHMRGILKSKNIKF